MSRGLVRNALLGALLAVAALGARADVSEARYTSFDGEGHAPIAVSEVRILDKEDPAEMEPVGLIEAQGHNDSDVDVLEQVNGLRLPGPLAIFNSNAVPSVQGADDAGLALHALKSVAARHGVQALLIIESERAQIRRDVVGHRLVAKAFRRKARRDKLS
ncbi:hypothetical protein [Azohydromonas lata]|uniref:Uncharacterized protein n=1 Tax=Azohydromonas lata TaxID=45677 RepID=A0ABU5ICU2_9BURK|nr:hypothetical protein [Azohydromonas lata]MDZ5456931.1 hypothetical protein [Azohydromonas lata]